MLSFFMFFFSISYFISRIFRIDIPSFTAMHMVNPHQAERTVIKKWAPSTIPLMVAYILWDTLYDIEYGEQLLALLIYAFYAWLTYPRNPKLVRIDQQFQNFFQQILLDSTSATVKMNTHFTTYYDKIKSVCPVLTDLGDTTDPHFNVFLDNNIYRFESLISKADQAKNSLAADKRTIFDCSNLMNDLIYMGDPDDIIEIDEYGNYYVKCPYVMEFAAHPGVYYVHEDDFIDFERIVRKFKSHPGDMQIVVETAKSIAMMMMQEGFRLNNQIAMSTIVEKSLMNNRCGKPHYYVLAALAGIAHWTDQHQVPFIPDPSKAKTSISPCFT